MNKRIGIILFLVITVFIDQYTKFLAVVHLKMTPARDYLGGVVRLIYAENKGAWGGFGSHFPVFFKDIIFIWLPILVLTALIVYLMYKIDLDRWHTYAYSFILSGGIGNIIDRVRLEYVVDFMYMGIGPIGTNIFNFADVFIMIGGGLLLYIYYLEWKEKKEEPQEA